ncbi:uncharacterized protein APUU_22190S [Aspergillus puulaauensis]|uniref:Uncharacterized protein n=1 Tax=Aspergillus puulaauensis TaxID=1220207 RepID=A0A7R8ALP5_9EURO|nr:uncharacterized protein APUU_22190S [Aspergillus puulaauensis]BCS21758.1 hypothetical protein APUU_22190S [Aspergillus puulaauensis]
MPPFQKICQELARLPVELAYQIICDLKVWDVLKLLWYDDPKLTAVVSSHPQCRSLLGEDDETFSQTRQIVKCYFAMYVKAGLPFKPAGDGYLSWGIDVLLAHKLGEPARKVIMKELREPIQSFLHTQIYAMDLERYLDRAAFPHGMPKLYTCDTVQDLGECMDAVLQAKKALFKQSSDQLQWAASLMEQNPDLLKRTLDPEQKQRLNTAHIVSRMRQKANRFRKCDVKHFIGSEYFAFYFFPVSPFDTSLAKLLRWMEKYGLNARMDDGTKNAHPPSIETHANIVMEGMPHFFTEFPPAQRSVTNDKGGVLRTVHPETDSGSRELFFTVHRIASAQEFRLPVRKLAREPNDEREQVWLASFVALYRYLEMLEKTSR